MTNEGCQHRNDWQKWNVTTQLQDKVFRLNKNTIGLCIEARGG